MGKNSGISWTDNTFNPWWGCVKVSKGCEHCYAESFSTRFGYGIWGPKSGRRFFGDKHWNEPRVWNAQAEKAGVMTSVFSGSMCDIFELREDLNPWRSKLFNLVEETPFLRWLLLSKRPENVEVMVPERWTVHGFPKNVWLGTTVEEQQYEDRVASLAIFDVKRFVSVEPMIGAYMPNLWWPIDWVIIGGESGPDCRTMKLVWAKNLLEACKVRSIPVFVKQLGGHPDKQHDPEKWPSFLQVQEFPWR